MAGGPSRLFALGSKLAKDHQQVGHIGCAIGIDVCGTTVGLRALTASAITSPRSPTDQPAEIHGIAGIGIGHAIASAHWIVFFRAGIVRVNQRGQNAGIPNAGPIVYSGVGIVVDRVGVGAPFYLC